MPTLWFSASRMTLASGAGIQAGGADYIEVFPGVSEDEGIVANSGCSRYSTKLWRSAE